MTTAFDEHQRMHWSGKAAAYERSFASLCAGAAPALLDAAEVKVRTRVLDVGTGTGTVARLAQQRGAIVAAVDAERTMVEMARADIPDVRIGALPDLPFVDRTFDVAVANFVINHVGDPRAAVRAMSRVVQADGVVAVTIWPATSPTMQLCGDAVSAAGVEPPALPRLEPEHDFPRTADGLAALLANGGITDVKTTMLSWEHRVDPEVWWSGPASGVANIGEIVTRQSPAVIDEIKRAYDRLAAAYLDPDGMLRLPVVAILASGRV